MEGCIYHAEEAALNPAASGPWEAQQGLELWQQPWDGAEGWPASVLASRQISQERTGQGKCRGQP